MTDDIKVVSINKDMAERKAAMLKVLENLKNAVESGEVVGFVFGAYTKEHQTLYGWCGGLRYLQALGLAEVVKEELHKDYLSF